MMQKCPCCFKPMAKIVVSGHPNYYKCKDHGQLISLNFLKSFKGTESLRSSLSSAPKVLPHLNVDKTLTCPACKKMMVTTRVDPRSHIRVDQCFRCGGIWFDTCELENIPGKGSMEALFPSLGSGVYETLDRNQAGGSGTNDHLVPKPAVRVAPAQMSVPAFLGLPFEDEHEAVQTQPVVTWLFVCGCILFTIFAIKQPSLFDRWHFDPSRPFRNNGTTILTSLFLHGSWGHLLGNIYFLWIFGDNVEDRIGQFKFLLLFVLAGTGGHAFYQLFGGSVPTIGASGAIAGIIAYYALAFPTNRITLTFGRAVIGFLNVSLSARSFAFGYFIFQQIYIFFLGPVNVNVFAHIGGLLTGAIYFFLGL